MKLSIVGIAGGLGNQMFQYSFYLSLKYWLAPNNFNKIYIAPYNHHNGYELDKIFNIKRNRMTNFLFGFIKKYLKCFVLRIYEQPGIDLKRIRIHQNKPIIYFSGYWQTERYFSNIEDVIRMKFSFNLEKISERNSSLLNEITNKNSISIHARRGDYVSNPTVKMILGDICGLDYYIKAIEYINSNVENPFFYFFSDEPEWVRENFLHLSLTNSKIIDWNKKENSWQDMMLMSRCKHNIIANSSFSWWGAWLNKYPNKIIIAPAKWFNKTEALDIVPENWIKI